MSLLEADDDARESQERPNKAEWRKVQQTALDVLATQKKLLKKNEMLLEENERLRKAKAKWEGDQNGNNGGSNSKRARRRTRSEESASESDDQGSELADLKNQLAQKTANFSKLATIAKKMKERLEGLVEHGFLGSLGDEFSTDDEQDPGCRESHVLLTLWAFRAEISRPEASFSSKGALGSILRCANLIAQIMARSDHYHDSSPHLSPKKSSTSNERKSNCSSISDRGNRTMSTSALAGCFESVSMAFAEPATARFAWASLLAVVRHIDPEVWNLVEESMFFRAPQSIPHAQVCACMLLRKRYGAFVVVWLLAPMHLYVEGQWCFVVVVVVVVVVFGLVGITWAGVLQRVESILYARRKIDCPIHSHTYLSTTCQNATTHLYHLEIARGGLSVSYLASAPQAQAPLSRLPLTAGHLTWQYTTAS